MTSNEFVIWLKGFTQAINDYDITPARWASIKDKLDEVNIDSIKGSRYTLDNSNWNINTTQNIKND